MKVGLSEVGLPSKTSPSFCVLADRLRVKARQTIRAKGSGSTEAGLRKAVSHQSDSRLYLSQ